MNGGESPVHISSCSGFLLDKADAADKYLTRGYDMLLDGVFDSVKRIKKVWIRKDGQLIKIDRAVESRREQPPLTKPMFPINKPRYEDPNA